MTGEQSRFRKMILSFLGRCSGLLNCGCFSVFISVVCDIPTGCLFGSVCFLMPDLELRFCECFGYIKSSFARMYLLAPGSTPVSRGVSCDWGLKNGEHRLFLRDSVYFFAAQSQASCLAAQSSSSLSLASRSKARSSASCSAVLASRVRLDHTSRSTH